MAKVGLKTGVLYRKRGMSGLKKVTVVLNVTRVEKNSDGLTRRGMQTGARAFVACAHLKTGGWIRVARGFEPTKLHDACGYGKNPRKAIASAMRAAAHKLSARSGAFAGYSRKNRRVRRTRRYSKRRG